MVHCKESAAKSMNRDLQSLKREIKQWETKFAEENHRKPTKEDIKTSNIKDVYLEYWRFKNSADNQDEQQSGSDVWSHQFNKASQSPRISNGNAQHTGSKFKSDISLKLWRSSLDSSKFSPSTTNCKNIKVPSYCYSNITKPVGQTNTNISNGTEIPSSVTKTKWTIPLSSSKILLNHCRRESHSSSVGLKNAAVDVQWLEKCLSSSQSDEKNSYNTFDSVPCSTSTCNSSISPEKVAKNDDIQAGDSLIKRYNNGLKFPDNHNTITIPETCGNIQRQSLLSDLPNDSSTNESDTGVSNFNENYLEKLNSTTCTEFKSVLQEDTNVRLGKENVEIPESTRYSTKFSDNQSHQETRSDTHKDLIWENWDDPGTGGEVKQPKRVYRKKVSSSDLRESDSQSDQKARPNTQRDPILDKWDEPVTGDEVPKPKRAYRKKVNSSDLGDSDIGNEGKKLKPASRKRKKSSVEDDPDSEDKVVKPKNKRLKSNTGRQVVSENFVKVNIKRKKFTRGPHRLKSRQIKRMAWKKRKWDSSKGKCFSCGQPGHWATNCPKKDELTINEEALNEAKNASSNIDSDTIPKGMSSSNQQKLRLPIQRFGEESISKQLPLYLKKFKHKQFRPFQEEAIRSILLGKSALLVLPTGSGKSLCYQIPACMYSDNNNCISLVISPLVSLIEDQIKNHPAFLCSTCLHSGLTQTQRQQNLERLKSGDAKVLLVAPESLLAMHAFFRTAFPPIAFACIDEAHCLSEWSHNFRPSYLQVLKILKDSLNVSCVLGLSATVTKGTTNRICCLLNIDPDEAVFGETFIPDNLLLSTSREQYKEEALLELLESERFQDLKSIIIYCTRRETTERLATSIRIHFHNTRQNYESNELKGKVLEDFVSAYHAGLSPAQRKSTQNKFMKGKLSIVVATVAFGMGLDKSDVRSVIHYDLPKSFESYVQEIGRAGRDGLPAYCHLFLQPQASDLWEHRRHIYANGVDRFAIRKLFNHIFKPPPQLPDAPTPKETTEVAISVEEQVQELDLNREIIETLLCYLELHPGKHFEILPVTNNTCTVKCYGGPEELERTIQKCKVLSVALQLSSTERTTCNISFSLVDVCSSMGWDCELVTKEMRNLQFASINGSWRRTGVLVEFTNPSFHVRMLKKLNSEEKDKLLNFVHDISTQLEKKELRKLDNLFKTFRRYSNSSFKKKKNETEVSDGLKEVLCDYFNNGHVNIEEDVPSQAYNINELRKEICAFLDIYHEEHFSAFQAAKIFYGIGSPQFPAEVWGKVRRFWRAFIHVDFPDILALAREEILRLRS